MNTNNETFETLFENDEEFQEWIWQKLANANLVIALNKIEVLEEEVKQLNDAINAFETIILDQHASIDEMFAILRGAVSAGGCLASELDSVIKLNNLKFKTSIFEK